MITGLPRITYRRAIALVKSLDKEELMFYAVRNRGWNFLSNSIKDRFGDEWFIILINKHFDIDEENPHSYQDFINEKL